MTDVTTQSTLTSSSTLTLTSTLSTTTTTTVVSTTTSSIAKNGTIYDIINKILNGSDLYKHQDGQGYNEVTPIIE